MPGWVPGIAPSQYPPGPHTPGTPLPYPLVAMSGYTGARAWRPANNMVVGLKSVAQLTLEGLFSGFQGITEVYNLATVGRINNHLSIPGNK